jgi:hypothetical protein
MNPGTLGATRNWKRKGRLAPSLTLILHFWAPELPGTEQEAEAEQCQTPELGSTWAWAGIWTPSSSKAPKVQRCY